MNISDRGVALLKEFEGYHRKLPNGDCIAYRCPANVLTLGWGCTVGIKEGMIWTPAQAEAALRSEVAKHEAAVARLVAVDLNQNQRDALILFSYNVGSGALSRSTLLRKLNRGDYPGAQAEFMRWNKAGGRTLRGLSIRRAREAALFAERVPAEQSGVDAEPDPLPQAIEVPKEPIPESTKAAFYTAAAGGGATVINQALVSPPPAAVTDTVSNVGMWQSIGRTGADIATTAWSYPLLTVGVAVVAIGVIWIVPYVQGRSSATH